MGVLSKRFQQGVFESLAATTRLQGSGGGSGLLPMATLGFAAAGNQGAYSTANSSTWTDITNTTFTINGPGRPVQILYLVFATAHLSAAGANGYIRGNIVGYDTTASPFFSSTGASNGFIWYAALGPGKGPLTPGQYTVKMQAATDNNTFNITVDQFFHHVFQIG